MNRTPYYYAGAPHAIVSLHPGPDGVTVAITWPCDDEKPGADCHLSFDSFKQLIAGAVQIQATTLEAQHSNQYELFTDEEGTQS